jgi:energy-coupling factor transporter ATP-binding protein EcfA2
MPQPADAMDKPTRTASVGHMPRVRLWAVVGRPSSGKSTLIGHLTSLFGPGTSGVDPQADGASDRFHQVTLQGGGLMRLYCLRRSWQEADMQPEEVVTTITEAAADLAAQKPPIALSYFNVLMSLELDSYPDPVRGPFGKAHEYLSHFAQVGWSLEKLVLLSPEPQHAHYERYGAPVLYLYNKERDPSVLPRPGHRAQEIGWSLSAVRNHFGWV